jgi:transposase
MSKSLAPTQCDWCRQLAALAAPLYDRLGELIHQSHCVQTDDTPAPVQEQGKE